MSAEVQKNLTQEEEAFIEQFLEKLPPFIARKKVDIFLGGIIAPQTLTNADSRGFGPDEVRKVGQSVVYPTRSLLLWIVRQYGVTKVATTKSF